MISVSFIVFSLARIVRKKFELKEKLAVLFSYRVLPPLSSAISDKTFCSLSLRYSGLAESASAAKANQHPDLPGL
jgi:hypothetical protein